MIHNHLNRYTKHGALLTGMLAAVLCLLLSCSKNNDLSGPPVITKVTMLDSTLQDSAFTKAFPGTLILITGQNLSGVVSVSFNGVDAYVNPTYNTSDHIILSIPGNAPTEAVDPKVPNQIKVTTTHGEAVYSFVVDIPPPTITAISNENALPGDSLIIYGSSLVLIEKITLPGGRDIASFVTSSNGSRVAFVMPDLGTDTGRLTIQAKFGSVTSDGPLNDHASGDVISNLTEWNKTGEPSVYNWSWGAIITSDAALFPGTRGGYVQSIFGSVGAWGYEWWTSNRSGNFNDVAIFSTDVLTQSAAQYALKFEINTKVAWTEGVTVLRFNDKYCFRYQPWLNATNKTFDTKNKWQTVTVKLSDFKLTVDGTEGIGDNAVLMGDLLKPDAKVAFSYRLMAEATGIALFNSAFDNFRIVKIK
ncbi:glycan-binding surface protein [Chitinophaga sp.]|uniref:glycan-binding surface protein n=1 Tax=Chitinophaga sp. TaxID=1869181 RepID=UPI002F94A791